MFGTVLIICTHHNEYFFHEWARERRGFSLSEMLMCPEVTGEMDIVVHVTAVRTRRCLKHLSY